jgi:hypothetical protein
MIRFLFRFIGLILLALAFILVIYDGMKSIVGNRLLLTNSQTFWELVSAGSLAKVRPVVEPYAGGLLWDPVMLWTLATPAWALLGFLGIVLLLFGRRKKPLIGYAR